MGMNNTNAAKAMEKLSSGLRINRAGDDAAGLSISEKMRAQIRGLDQGARNAQDGISLIQTAEGGLNETHAILQRMRELAVQAANDTNQTKDREAIMTEINEYVDEIDHIAKSTTFNGQNLLNATGSLTLQIGPGTTNDSLALNLNSFSASSRALGIGTLTVSSTLIDGSIGALTVGSIGSNSGAKSVITSIDSAIEKVSTARAKLGAIQNRLEHTITNLNTMSENLTASESRIRDVDMAKEIMNFSKNNILNQAAQAMLAQANQQPQGVLQLLR
jgi:flagellin